ncbi:MurR/RpiR family transcriptional regulator [Sporomusa sphaeroides]|uniref:DNA-binding transcriptional repressor RpiR n=2 Tax=Sporomusa TaxID=2375 RepID=A0ABM9W1G2_9FIRM|nr:MurR/RpiR family transcriptional regulator [Sporomusa sphaeroides]OLS56684.1 putative HTH-type transcriptional regulator YbbH [Sporomusa sphaeroides DSM 2875]CVK18631.1 DNA-binding transcriptional repressor RpiR [Sporomusa sphaeroides DSM 2875]SCM82053.1 putative Transcriptional regulator family protein (RpiR) [uncultured Sporomusa sp.]
MMKLNILQKIQSSTNDLTKAQLQVSEYIQNNLVEASFQTLDQIAASIGTSTTTVMRFAFSLGFSGYSELQKELQNYIRRKLSPESRLEKNLEMANETSLITKCAEKQIDNIKNTQEMLTEEVIQESIRLIKKAKSIYFLGARTSFTIAFFLYQSLAQQLDNCELLPPAGQDIDQILNITTDDLMIVISLPRYANSTIEMVKAIRKLRKPSIITITDGFAAPLVPYSDIILPCEYDSLSYHNSMTAPLYIADLLITELSQTARSKVTKRLADTEELAKLLNYHY